MQRFGFFKFPLLLENGVEGDGVIGFKYLLQLVERAPMYFLHLLKLALSTETIAKAASMTVPR